jgi:hypothetical protein
LDIQKGGIFTADDRRMIGQGDRAQTNYRKFETLPIYPGSTRTYDQKQVKNQLEVTIANGM